MAEEQQQHGAPPNCNCGEVAALRQAGPNTKQHPGEYFYACPKPREQACKYFRWFKEEFNTPKKPTCNKYQAYRKFCFATAAQDNKQTPSTSNDGFKVPSIPQPSKNESGMINMQTDDLFKVVSNLCVQNSILSNRLGKMLNQLEDVTKQATTILNDLKRKQEEMDGNSSGSERYSPSDNDYDADMMSEPRNKIKNTSVKEPEPLSEKEKTPHTK